MQKPLSAGDVCEVIGGFQKRSPNLGMHVTVVARIYGVGGSDHWEHGPIWRCSGKGIQIRQTEGPRIVADQADFAAKWLRRIDEVPPGIRATKRKTASA